MQNHSPAHTVYAFTDGPNGGNPAGVVLHADALSTSERQAIAAQVGLSETAFVSRSYKASFRVEFFTPNKQIPDCGHATVATFALLKQQGLLADGKASKEILNGVREVLIQGDTVAMEQRAPKFRPIPDLDLVLQSIGITRADLLPGHTPEIVETEVAFLNIPVKNQEVLKGLEPHFDLIHSISVKEGLVGFYVFSLDSVKPGRDATTRMFAPLYGITEESATGMAAGTLAALLYTRFDLRKPELVIEQGHFMSQPSPSLLRAQVDAPAGRIEKITVGGTARVLAEGPCTNPARGLTN